MLLSCRLPPSSVGMHIPALYNYGIHVRVFCKLTIKTLMVSMANTLNDVTDMHTGGEFPLTQK